jgi:hypothetical protein
MIGQRAKDVDATSTSIVALNTSAEAGHFTKIKINRDNIIDVIRARDKATKLHRTLTTPFTADRWRLIDASLINDYSKEMSAYKAQFYDAVADVVNRWDTIVISEKNRLGPIFKAHEYPNKNEVENEFEFYHKLKPVPDEGHIVVDLEIEVLNDLKADLRKENADNLKRSVKDIWHRLFEPVNNMANICLNDKKIFGTLIDKLQDIVTIIPALNIIDDPDIAETADEIKNRLLVHTTGQLRDDKQLKKHVGKEADDLAQKIRSFTDSIPSIN